MAGEFSLTRLFGILLGKVNFVDFNILRDQSQSQKQGPSLKKKRMAPKKGANNKKAPAANNKHQDQVEIAHTRVDTNEQLDLLKPGHLTPIVLQPVRNDQDDEMEQVQTTGCGDGPGDCEDDDEELKKPSDDSKPGPSVRKQPKLIDVPHQLAKSVSLEAPMAGQSTVNNPVVNDQPKKTSKKKKQASRPSFGRYISRLAKMYRPEIRLTSSSVQVLDSFVYDMLERFGTQATDLLQKRESNTVTVPIIRTACKLILPGELGTHALIEGNKAVANYENSKQL